MHTDQEILKVNGSIGFHQNNWKNVMLFMLLYLLLKPGILAADERPVSLGYSVSLKGITTESMNKAKAAGISCVETSLADFIDKKERKFLLSEGEIREHIKAAKVAADGAGIKIWSIHMPFSDKIDLSLADEAQRKEVVALHKKVLELCSLLEPEIILFHPSYFLGRNERELRKKQMVRSALELNKAVKRKGFRMVIENMLGKDVVTVDGKREYPLCRDVQETLDIMSKLPASIGSAIDFNHIQNPQQLILAMGKRLKHIHVADGDGLKERHYLPCSGEGMNDWGAIFSALATVAYKEPFLYECKMKDVKELKPCYEALYENYKMSLSKEK